MSSSSPAADPPPPATASPSPGLGASSSASVSQSRLYDLLEQLQRMTQSEVPAQLQQRMPSDMLATLANALADEQGHLFQIVRMLTEVQNATEKQLFKQRVQLQGKMQAEKMSFDVGYRASISSATSPDDVLELTGRLDADREAMRKRHEEELRQFDTDLVLQIDQKVAEQQLTLEQAGVPGFRVTNNPTEVRVQMHLVDFVRRLDPDSDESR